MPQAVAGDVSWFSLWIAISGCLDLVDNMRSAGEALSDMEIVEIPALIPVLCIRLSHEAPLSLTIQVHAAARATATPWRFRSLRSLSVRMSTAAIRHNAPAAKNAGR